MALSLFYGSPRGSLSSNAPTLIDRIKFIADTRGRLQVRANIPQFNTQVTSGKASTNVPNMISVAILAAHPFAFASTNQSKILSSMVLGGFSVNQFNGNQHTLVSPQPTMMTLVDTYIECVSWSGMANGGHAFEIRNSRGDLIVREVALQQNDSSFFRIKVSRIAVGGYQVPVLDSGVLLVTVGRMARNGFGGRG